MFKNNLGYVFEGRYDANKNIGVMNSFKVLFKGNEQHVSFICAVDKAGNPVQPSLNNLSIGFQPLSDTIKTEEDLQTFVKSNKPYFSVFGQFQLLVGGFVVYDRNTKEVLSTKGLSFYVPKTVSTNIPEVVDNKGNQQPSVICDVLSTKDQLHGVQINSLVYSGYYDNLLKSLTADVMTSRLELLKYLVLNK